MSKILLATEKPFAADAVQKIKNAVAESQHTLTILESYTDQQQLHEAIADADALIIRSDKVDRAVIEAGKQLKIVVRAGAGYDNVDLAAATEHNVVVMNTPGQNANAVAELVIGFMIFQSRKQFNGSSGTEIRGKKLGIVGYGNIGRLVANAGKALGMEVMAYDKFVEASVKQQ